MLSTESFYTTVEQRFNSTFFYLFGVVASSEQPFRILLNDQVGFQRRHLFTPM